MTGAFKDRGWKSRLRLLAGKAGNAPPLAKIYVEPTTRCNLECTTCMRHSWNEPSGQMEADTFESLLRGLAPVRSVKTMAFWGIGEPLMHPGIADMVGMAHGQGYRTELITNALLLSERAATDLIKAGLDYLVASVDGTTPESYADIRAGGNFGRLVKNVMGLNAQKARMGAANPEAGLEFVASRKNVSELPRLLDLAQTLDAGSVIVTNVVPYSEEYKDGILYWLTAGNAQRPATYLERGTKITMPGMDPAYRHTPRGASGYPSPRVWSGPDRPCCPFAAKGAMAIRWDGTASPCVALMHSHSCFFLDRPKTVLHYGLGNVRQETAPDIWNKEEYVRFRDRVLRFDFPPCNHCDCDLARTNEEDCCGTPFPTCGDCLWAQGIALCP